MCFLAQLQRVILLGLQKDFYQRYGEHKELSQYLWEAKHTTLPIASTSAIVSQLSTKKIERLLNQVPSEKWRPSIWSHLKSEIQRTQVLNRKMRNRNKIKTEKSLH